MHHADLDTSGLAPGSSVSFTFYWPAASRWEGADFSVAVAASEDEEPERKPRPSALEPSDLAQALP